MDFYTILGIPPDADEEAIRIAYRKLARRYHPDAGPGSSTEKFREVAQAYETLSDPRRREAYNVCLRAGDRRPAPIEPITQPEPMWGWRQQIFTTPHGREPGWYADELFELLFGSFEGDPFSDFFRRW